MPSPVENLHETLALERIEVNLFRGTAPQGFGPRIYGGHVIAQSLMAAYRTVEDRYCHSLHCYFIRPGDPRIPIVYEVDRSRDGKSFATRRVIAIQNGAQIFNLAASFQVPESGFEHQDAMPNYPGPEVLPEDERDDERPRAIELRFVERHSWQNPVPAPAVQNVWMRPRFEVGDDPVMNQVFLAYASDMTFMSTSMRPHAVSWQTPGFQSASLDHAIWFQRACRFDDWHLYAQRSPSAAGTRGINFGEVFDRQGRLVATMAQEGLIRLHKG
jgi:acyl-CoA thioesterase II